MASKKTYTKEFKEEAVRLARQNGNVTETARNLGLQLSVLRRWKKELEDHGEKAFPGKGHLADEELRQLQKRKPAVKGNGRDIKKSGGYLHKPLRKDTLSEEHRDEYPLERLCEALDVSVSGYYA